MSGPEDQDGEAGGEREVPANVVELFGPAVARGDQVQVVEITEEDFAVLLAFNDGRNVAAGVFKSYPRAIEVAKLKADALGWPMKDYAWVAAGDQDGPETAA